MEPLENPRKEPKLREDFLLGVLRAALKPSRIDLGQVRRALRAISFAGYNPVKLYRQALLSRPENYERVPPLQTLLPKDLPREGRLDLALGTVLQKGKRRSKTESKPSSRETNPRTSKVPKS